MYDTFIRAAKPFVYRYPLEEAQGAYGTPAAPDDHSASRYVEMRSSELADYLFQGLEKDAIKEYYNNYDDTEKIPAVFPSVGFWNIVNGFSGIAVSFSTSCPSFNLKEVNDALIKIIKNPSIDFDEIYCAPDYPTGCTIVNGDAAKESLKNGKGETIKLRATLTYVPDQHMIRVTNLPANVFVNTILNQLKELTEENENYGIERVIDHTKKEADVYIYLNKKVSFAAMRRKLYKDTSLEYNQPVNMIMLDHGIVPKLFGWRAACDAYIEHIRECRRNEIQFDLNKALAREEILNGLVVAAANIDNIVKIIRSSENAAEAAQRLTQTYELTNNQVKAILGMKLSSLTKVDGAAVKEQLADIILKIEKCNILLSNPSSLDETLIASLEEVSKKFGDVRRTKVEYTKEEENENFLDTEYSVSWTMDNCLNAAPLNKKEKEVPARAKFTCSLGDVIAVFTKEGEFYGIPVSSFAEQEALPLNQDVVFVSPQSYIKEAKSLIFVTKGGLVKKTSTSEKGFDKISKRKAAALTLREGDELINVFLSSSAKDRLLIATNTGYGVYFLSNEIAATGRAAQGVKSIKLKEGEWVAAAAILYDHVTYEGVVTVSSDGRAKMTPTDDLILTARAARGNILHSLDETLHTIIPIPLDTKLLYLVMGGRTDKISLSSLPVQGRNTKGNKITTRKLKEFLVFREVK